MPGRASMGNGNDEELFSFNFSQTFYYFLLTNAYIIHLYIILQAPI